jgi:hypothetical protein
MWGPLLTLQGFACCGCETGVHARPDQVANHQNSGCWKMSHISAASEKEQGAQSFRFLLQYSSFSAVDFQILVKAGAMPVRKLTERNFVLVPFWSRFRLDLQDSGQQGNRITSKRFIEGRNSALRRSYWERKYYV